MICRCWNFVRKNSFKGQNCKNNMNLICRIAFIFVGNLESRMQSHSLQMFFLLWIFSLSLFLHSLDWEGWSSLFLQITYTWNKENSDSPTGKKTTWTVISPIKSSPCSLPPHPLHGGRQQPQWWPDVPMFDMVSNPFYMFLFQFLPFDTLTLLWSLGKFSNSRHSDCCFTAWVWVNKIMFNKFSFQLSFITSWASELFASWPELVR